MNYKKYVDKYFLRSKEILKKENFNPYVKMQCFIRKGPGRIKGIDEAVKFLRKNSTIESVGGKIYGLKELSKYKAGDTIMTLEAPLQSIIDFETIYLGIISAETTILNDKTCPDMVSIRDHMRVLVNLISKRPIMYFGARHWRYDKDAEISKATFNGGAFGCSTDEGASTNWLEGMGTIPHALVIVFAYKYGKDNATLEATKAFDKHIDKKINRIALVDTYNKEITDSLAVAKHLKDRLYGVRLDTCGENFGEGSNRQLKGKYLFGKGVTVELAKNVRNTLDKNGFENVKIVLSSGFANVDKVKAFVNAEKRLSVKLFDSMGIGQLFHSRTTTADIMEIEGKPFGKTGRKYKPNKNLIRRM